MRNDPRAERRLEILKAVVRAFIAEGEPVGSRVISELPGCDVSSATIRNIMAELEEMGYLSHPHASAGRVPTETGYRVYVDLLLEERRRRGDPAGDPALPAALLRQASGLEDVLLATSRELARLCGCVGLVLHPTMSRTRFRHAQFIRLDRGRVVGLVVGEDGVVTDRVIQLEEDFTQAELDRISNYLVNRFQGHTLIEVQQTLERELQAERPLYDEALGHWLRLTLACLEPCVEPVEVYVEGAARCVEAPDFSDVERVRHLLRAYEEKGRIAGLLRRCLVREGVQIHIGNELAAGEGGQGAATGGRNDDQRGLSGLPGLAFVAVPYGDARGPLGSVGVLGPTRMEYERVIAVVDRVGRDLGQALRSGFPASH